MFKAKLYDKDYYEDGILTKKSCWVNYSWMPELTCRMAQAYIDYLKLNRKHRILVHGCAKGFEVKALRILFRQAWGYEISRYAIKNFDISVKRYLKLSDGFIPFKQQFDYFISKDTLEHISYEMIDEIIQDINQHTKFCFAIIPLGENGKYFIEEYERDYTHQIRENKNWWIEKFEKNGFKLMDFRYKMRGIKEHWWRYNTLGNGFFLFQRNKSG